MMAGDESRELALARLKDFVITLSDFRIDHVLGNGTFGEVYHARHLRSGKEVAIKALDIESLKGASLKMFLREVQVLAKCRSRFVMRFVGFTIARPFSIVAEFVRHGDLGSVISGGSSLKITPTQYSVIALGIAEGMRAIHECNIIHRDLKVANVLLGDDMLPKICDFGASRFMDGEGTTTGRIGTLLFMAPEVIMSKGYTRKADVFSFGIVMWIILAKKMPWERWNHAEVMEKVGKFNQRPAFPLRGSRQLKDFIGRCWAADPDERPEFAEICDALRTGDVLFPGTDRNEFLRKVTELDLSVASSFDTNDCEKEEASGPQFALPSDRLSSALTAPSEILLPDKDGVDAEVVLMFPDAGRFMEEDGSLLDRYEVISMICRSIKDDAALACRFADSVCVDMLNYKVLGELLLARFILLLCPEKYARLSWEAIAEAGLSRFQREVLHLFSLLADQRDDVNVEPLHVFYRHAMTFISAGAAHEVIPIVMCLRAKAKDTRQMDQILSGAFASDETDTVLVTTYALYTLSDLNFLDVSIITRHILERPETDLFIGLFLRRKADPSILCYIKPMIGTSETAVMLVCDIALCDIGAQMLVQDIAWISVPCAFPIVCVLLRNEKTHIPIMRSIHFALMLGKLEESQYELISYIIATTKPEEKTVANMLWSGFLPRFMDWVVANSSSDVAVEALAVLAECSPVPEIATAAQRLRNVICDGVCSALARLERACNSVT